MESERDEVPVGPFGVTVLDLARAVETAGRGGWGERAREFAIPDDAVALTTADMGAIVLAAMLPGDARHAASAVSRQPLHGVTLIREEASEWLSPEVVAESPLLFAWAMPTLAGSLGEMFSGEPPQVQTGPIFGVIDVQEIDGVIARSAACVQLPAFGLIAVLRFGDWSEVYYTATYRLHGDQLYEIAAALNAQRCQRIEAATDAYVAIPPHRQSDTPARDTLH